MNGRCFRSERRKSCGRVSRLGPTLEDRDIGTGGKLTANFVAVGRVVIVLGEALANLAGGDADYRIRVGVITWRAAEDLHADGAFLDLVRVTVQSLFHDEAKQGWITFALEEKRVNEEEFKLGEDCGFLRLGLWEPRFQGGAERP
jgi:hypothetical protein